MDEFKRLVDDVLLEVFLGIADGYGLEGDELDAAFKLFEQRLPYMRKLGKIDFVNELIDGMIRAMLEEAEDDADGGKVPVGVTIMYFVPSDQMCEELESGIEEIADRCGDEICQLLAKYGIDADVWGEEDDDLEESVAKSSAQLGQTGEGTEIVSADLVEKRRFDQIVGSVPIDGPEVKCDGPDSEDEHEREGEMGGV